MFMFLFFLFFIFQRIPKNFNEHYGQGIPNDIILNANNGDKWFCEYDHMNCRIVGLESFMKFYGVTFYWSLVMTFSGIDEFVVNIFSPKCCEIFYPKVCNVDFKLEGKDTVDFEIPLNHSIPEENGGALFFSNVSWSDFSFFRLMIQPIHLNQEHDKVVFMIVHT